MKKPIEKINNTKVLLEALRIVRQTEVELLLTMNLLEEKGEVSEEFNFEIAKALDRGVQIERVCFGTRKELNRLIYNFDDRIIISHINDVKLFQRMIISDKKRMLFRLDNKFFRSEDDFVASTYLRYIDDVKIKGR